MNYISISPVGNYKHLSSLTINTKTKTFNDLTGGDCPKAFMTKNNTDINSHQSQGPCFGLEGDSAEHRICLGFEADSFLELLSQSVVFFFFSCFVFAADSSVFGFLFLGLFSLTPPFHPCFDGKIFRS